MGFSDIINKNKAYKILLISLNTICLIVTLILFFLQFYEWFNIGVISDPNTIKNYYFGAESMIEKGGIAYSSKNHYIWINLIGSIIALITIIIAIFIFIKKKWILFLVVLGTLIFDLLFLLLT